jgi:hypothetical protein
MDARDIFYWRLIIRFHLSWEEFMARKAKGREWTAGDVRDLKSLAKKKMPAGKIAKSLKRTVGATRQKAFSLGVSLDTRG